MNDIQLTIRFKEYQLCRVKATNQGVAYTHKGWVGKTTTIIPMPYSISEKVIERECKNDDGTYSIITYANTMITKPIHDGKNVGRVYLPKEWIGLDVLIIEAPNYDELY